MKNNAMLAVALVVIAGLFVALRSTDAQGVAKVSTGKIAVVNVSKALTECQEYLDRQKETEKRGTETRAEMGKISDSIDSLSNELKNVYEPGSKEYSEKLKEWFDKKARLEALKEYEKETLTIETQVWTEALYKKLEAATAQVARENDLTLVVNKDDTDLANTRNIQELFAVIRGRQVIYNSPTLDITGMVIEKMDSAK